MKSLRVFAWFIYRLTVLNTLVLAITYILSFLRNVFESTDLFIIKFPFELYITAFFLTNLVYIIGNFFEIVYLRIWNKRIELRKFEKRFFRGGIVMFLFINSVGVIRYIIYYYD